MRKIFTFGAFFALLLVSGFVCAATVAEMIAAGDTKGLEEYLDSNPAATDDVVKSLLKFTQDNLGKQPELAGKMMEFAASHASEITPPSVPVICADIRRIVSALPVDAVGTPLFTSVIAASQSFAKAPVVVAAGRPNLCEEALLAQLPGYVPATLPPGKRKPSAE